MLEKGTNCEGCPLQYTGQGFILPEGTGSNRVLITGESAGYNEILDGLPFRPQAPAGSVLQRAINMTKHSRSMFIINNLCMCRPPADLLSGARYEIGAINHCGQAYYDKVIADYKPKVILATGMLPFKYLTGLTFPISLTRGYVYKSPRYPDVLVIPSYHSSYIRRGNMKYLQLLLRDLHKATLLAQEKLTEGVDYILDPLSATRQELDYNTNPSHEAAKWLLDKIKSDPSLLLAYDIETEKSAGASEDEMDEYGTKITQIQFSIGAGTGIAFPFAEPFIRIARQILAADNPKAGWNNWRFDRPILRKAGIEINGRDDDGMWCYHHFKPDLPLGLQQVASWYSFPFAWKHMASSNLPFYGIADVDSVYRIMQKLPADLKSRGLWGEYNNRDEIYTGYEGLVYHINPILEEMSKRGIPINREKQVEFSAEIDREKERIEAELKPLIPDSILRVRPKNGYIREPKEVVEAFYQYNATSSSLSPNEFIRLGTGLVLKTFAVEAPKPKKKKGEITFEDQLLELEPQMIEVERWCKVLPFNPNSSDQISDYIKLAGDEERAKKAITKLSKEKPLDSENGGSRKKENLKTSAEVLKRLYAETGNIVYKLILEYKGLTKMQGTYAGGSYIPAEDDRVHTEFLFRPATMQLSSRKPNVQNYPVHSALAKKFKRTIEAREGHTFIKADFKSFHALMVGFLAEDLDYMRLCRLDIHSYVAAHMARLPEASECLHWDDEKLGAFLKQVKKDYSSLRNDQAKHAILGIPYGLSEKGCYERYRDDFNPTAEEVNSRKRVKLNGERLQKAIQAEGLKRVKNLYALLRKEFPKVFAWQTEVKRQAHDRGYLQTPFGARREFTAVRDFKYTGSGKEILEEKNGEDAEKAASYLPQNNSFCHMRETMLLLEKEGYLEKYKLINTIHDSLEFECPDDLVDEAIDNIAKVMSRKSKILVSPSLGAFECQVDIARGKNLAPYDEETNPEGMRGI